MGYADRDYMKKGAQMPQERGFGGRSGAFFLGAPVTKFLVIANTLVFFLEVFIREGNQDTFLTSWGLFTIYDCFHHFELWRLISAQFLHYDMGHLLANMVGMVVFGRWIERKLSSVRYCVFYLLSGVAGTLFYTLLFYLPYFFDDRSVYDGAVGASGGLFGVMAVFYCIAPKDLKVYLFFVFPIQLRILAVVIIVMEVVRVLFQLDNAGGSAAHLGGAIFGVAFFQIKFVRIAVRKIAGFFEELGKHPRPAKKKKTIARERMSPQREQSPIEVSKEVDRILEKIGEEGMQALTNGERETLAKARRN